MFPFSSLFEKLVLSNLTLELAGNFLVLLIRRQFSTKLLYRNASPIVNVSIPQKSILFSFEIVKIRPWHFWNKESVCMLKYVLFWKVTEIIEKM